MVFFFFAEDIKKWWTWGYWISPIMYAQNAVVVNEFLGKNWGVSLRILFLEWFNLLHEFLLYFKITFLVKFMGFFFRKH